MDITQILENITRDAESMLKTLSKLLAVIGAIRIIYLYHSGRDRKMIFEELLHWACAIIFFSSIPYIYDKLSHFLER